jgi:DNA-binding XRE family transcriptional regulator
LTIDFLCDNDIIAIDGGVKMAAINKLGQILEQRGLKQNFIAEKANLDKSTIGNIIKNRFGTNVEVAIRIARVLDLKVEDIWEVID